MGEGGSPNELNKSLSQREKVLVAHASRSIIFGILKEPLFSDEKWAQDEEFRDKYFIFLSKLALDKQFGQITQEKQPDFTLAIQIQKIPKQDINSDIRFVISPIGENYDEESPSNSVFIGFEEVLEIYQENNELPEGSKEIIDRFISSTYSFANPESQDSTEE